MRDAANAKPTTYSDARQNMSRVAVECRGIYLQGQDDSRSRKEAGSQAAGAGRSLERENWNKSCVCGANFRFSAPVLPSAVRKVDSIREIAEAKGWPIWRLYRDRAEFPFPFGEGYGLACFLGPNDEIGEIAEAFIEIVRVRAGRKSVTRFSNPNAAREKKIDGERQTSV